MDSTTDIVQIHKMVFVFNAILAGWTVRMIDERTFEFKKDRSTQDVNLDDYLRRFVMHNLNIENISLHSIANGESFSTLIENNDSPTNQNTEDPPDSSHQ